MTRYVSRVWLFSLRYCTAASTAARVQVHMDFTIRFPMRNSRMFLQWDMHTTEQVAISEIHSPYIEI